MTRVTPSSLEVRQAATRITNSVARTPLRRSDALSRVAGGDVFLKLETEQITGSFKLRGAFNSLMSLNDDERARGIIASSAGNHGLGVAYAARALGIDATIFVPAAAPRVKREGIAALGATVDATQPDYDAAMARARQVAAETKKPFIHPCLGNTLLAGQGTVAIEILEQLPSVASVMTPVGGAGLLGGIAGFLRDERPDIPILGAQTEHTNAVKAALDAGRQIDIPIVPSIADGLAGQIDAEAYDIAVFGLDELTVVTEADAAAAIAWLWKNERVKAEGAGCVGVAAILTGKSTQLTFPVACIVSGRNIDDDRFEGIVGKT